MKTHFFLRGNKEPKTIYLKIRKGKNENTMFSTNWRVKTNEWDIDKERVKNTSKNLNRNNINIFLNDMSCQVDNFINSNNSNISLKEVSNFINDIMHPKQEIKQTFANYLLEYIQECEIRKSERTGEALTWMSRQKYIQLKNIIDEYCQDREIKELLFEDLNTNFYNDFINYLESKNMAKNTIGKYIRSLKTVIINAEKKGIEVNKDYNDFRVLKEDIFNIYLTDEELKKIEDVVLPQPLSYTRDLFLIGCYTGLRYSDFSRLTTDNIENGNIRIKQQKTGADVIIPLLSDYVKRLIEEKTNYKVPASQVMNRRLKDICKRAGINGIIKKTRTEGGKRIEHTFEKWEMVTNHTARRSFATNLYKKNVPSISLMKLTGHTTETAFLKYIKIDNEENAELIKEQLNNNK
jgi:integrase